ncbi:MAG: tRNA glutamyl-Q(34) synthetase GluQRS [Erythrobacter sp.]|uniref:tRNA glutamyl-Q(34) synthetase GluQRS n=1 Tax=Erythrobacter sp. TaxID=1042 RepID=UPI00261F779A|nr:tRNA glutamyl-Q(34) synthetase GluQRS [Erythrobacter sp.]MDJ0979469.1 tRNA glutamyl-Q(34) synthetase GluQRS [Erythrobacter sp.]
MSVVTRFAPSPNGPLHLGHAFSAIVAADEAAAGGGEFLLRIEDIDGPRTRPELADEFRRDLEWLGLQWREVPAQSTRLESYRQAASRLEREGLLYRCVATRRDMAAIAPRRGADGIEYPGSAKGLYPPASLDEPFALRLDLDAALERVGDLVWEDQAAGCVHVDPREFGDVVLVRKDLPASYHLAVTLDDAADGVTLVTRGRDLFASTDVHRVLQELLGLPVPRYLHHDLIMDSRGRKLSKSRGSAALSDRRRAGEDGLQLARELRARRKGAGT